MNVLWIMADQLQADCLGFMGNPVIQTPHLMEYDPLETTNLYHDPQYQEVREEML